jgi:hypothetical protein
MSQKRFRETRRMHRIGPLPYRSVRNQVNSLKVNSINAVNPIEPQLIHAGRGVGAC